MRRPFVRVLTARLSRILLPAAASLSLITGASALSLIPVSDEIAMGREAQRQVRKTVPSLADSQVTAYTARIGRALAAHAPGPKYPYSFSVANYRDLNAFALPGGPVWIH